MQEDGAREVPRGVELLKCDVFRAAEVAEVRRRDRHARIVRCQDEARGDALQGRPATIQLGQQGIVSAAGQQHGQRNQDWKFHRMGLPHSGNPVSYSRKEKVDSAAKMQSSKVKGEAEIFRRRLLKAAAYTRLDAFIAKKREYDPQLRFRSLMGQVFRVSKRS